MSKKILKKSNELVEVVLKHFEKLNGGTKLTKAQKCCLSDLEYDIADGIDMPLKLYHDTVTFFDALKENRHQLKAPTDIFKIEKDWIKFTGSAKVLFWTPWETVAEALGYEMSELYRYAPKDASN